MEWAILCASGFSFWVDRTYVFLDIFFLGDRTYVFPDVFFLGDRTYAFPDIIFLRWIEFMYFQIFFRGQNLCVSNHFLGDRIYVFPTIFRWIEFMCVSRYFS